jgi:Transposase zinc-ribbon domain
LTDIQKILEGFRHDFPHEPACEAYLERLLWPGGFACAKCSVVGKPYRIASRPGVLRCRACKAETRVAVGTPMERSQTPLSIWFAAAFLLVRSKDLWSGSAYKAQHLLGLSRYETTLEIIRKLKGNMAVSAKLNGVVEIGFFDVKVRGLEAATVWAGINRAGEFRVARAQSAQEFIDGAVDTTAEINGQLNQIYDDEGDYEIDSEKIDALPSDDEYNHEKLVMLGRSVRQWLARRKAVSNIYLKEYIQEYEFIAYSRKNPDTAFDALIGPRADSRVGPLSWLPLFRGR